MEGSAVSLPAATSLGHELSVPSPLPGTALGPCCLRKEPSRSQGPSPPHLDRSPEAPAQRHWSWGQAGTKSSPASAHQASSPHLSSNLSTQRQEWVFSSNSYVQRKKKMPFSTLNKGNLCANSSLLISSCLTPLFLRWFPT